MKPGNDLAVVGLRLFAHLPSLRSSFLPYLPNAPRPASGAISSC